MDVAIKVTRKARRNIIPNIPVSKYFLLIIIISSSIQLSHSKRLRTRPIPSELGIVDSCRSSLECALSIPRSHCEWEERKCTCLPYHVEYNKTSCLPASLLGFGCSITEQCRVKVPDSECIDGLCQCKSNFVHIRRDKCVPPAKVNDYCLNDQQCRLGDKYTHCKYIIPRIYGKCRCPNGYVLTDDKRCLPSIGSKCETDSECSKVSPNSQCQSSPSGLSASTNDSVCGCPPNFKLSHDKLSCIPLIKQPESPNNIIGENDPAAADLAPLSLGKACTSSMECQIRDPYSACINGICECISRASKCNSLNPGCHNDTFQCRNGQCISWYFVCDKAKNCEDNSDEDGCIPFKCPKEAFQCDDGTCLSRSAVCNGRWECPDGSDEARCYKGIPCDRKSFRCKSGQCLPQYAFCNAVTDCLDGSDENQDVCELSAKCPKGTFQCDNKKCRSTAILCSGRDGCGDNSDEDRCEVCYCEKPLNY
ncbi:uncharacterized protein LOC141851772 [Brevipalpus obovatus]|uniref:uncharacterized protein LOC141851772 n=1 Tax=Brevipalpus obovatus TaxID=246614 RepID=UPI003D9E044C